MDPWGDVNDGTVPVKDLPPLTRWVWLTFQVNLLRKHETETCGSKPVSPLMLMADGNGVAAWDSQGWTPVLHDMWHASLTPASELADGWNGMWLNRICFDPWCWQSFGRNWLQIGPTSERGCPSTAVPRSLSWSTPSVLPSPSTTHDSSLPLMPVGRNHILMFLFK